MSILPRKDVFMQNFLPTLSLRVKAGLLLLCFSFALLGNCSFKKYFSNVFQEQKTETPSGSFANVQPKGLHCTPSSVQEQVLSSSVSLKTQKTAGTGRFMHSPIFSEYAAFALADDLLTTSTFSVLAPEKVPLFLLHQVLIL